MNIRKNTLLATAAAAALMVSANFAVAQGMHQEGSPPAAEQHEPGAKGAPVEKGKPGQSMAPQAQPKGAPQKAEEGGGMAKPGMKAGENKPVGEEKGPNERKTGQNAQGEHSKPETAESPKANPENKSTTPGAATNNEPQKSGEPQKNNAANPSTTGKKTAVNLSTEQRTKIRTVIKNDVHVAPVTNVNFNVSIGTAVPRTVHFYPLPQDVLEIYPEWRGYDFIVVRDEIVIVEPDTYEIVYIIS